MKMRWFVWALPLQILIAVGIQAADYALPLPAGLDRRAVMIPADNPLTADKIALGKQLFWDKRWSRDSTAACVDCHLPEHGWSDPRPLSIRAGRVTRRRSPTVVNRVFSELQAWDGRAPSIEGFVKGDPNLVIDGLRTIPGYQDAFRRVFGTEPTEEAARNAVSAYFRTIISGNSPYDRHRAGDTGALSPAARRGLVLFEGKARCAACHAGFNFTDEGYHNLGVGMDKENPDLGRFTISKREVNKGAFKTPTLRHVAPRPPYMHDGSLRTLRDVIAFYNRGGFANPWRSSDISPLNLTAGEQEDLVTFLEALTGEVAREVTTPPVLP
jgi:cytochrome c peroxidase